MTAPERGRLIRTPCPQDIPQAGWPWRGPDGSIFESESPRWRLAPAFGTQRSPSGLWVKFAWLAYTTHAQGADAAAITPASALVGYETPTCFMRGVAVLLRSFEVWRCDTYCAQRSERCECCVSRLCGTAHVGLVSNRLAVLGSDVRESGFRQDA